MIETKTDASTDVESRDPVADYTGARDRETGSSSTRKGFSKRTRRLLGIVVIALIAALVWYFFFHKPAAPDSVVALSGRLEGDESAVAPKTGGRIVEIRVREGDSVKAGDTIAVLDDQQVRAKTRLVPSFRPRRRRPILHRIR